MKLSTLALGALISFSLNTLAQDKPKTTNTTKKVKSVKAKNSGKPLVKQHSVDSLSIEPYRNNCEPKVKQSAINSTENSPRNICYACGRG